MDKALEHSFRLQRLDQLSRLVTQAKEHECLNLIQELIDFELNLIHENATSQAEDKSSNRNEK